MDGLVDILITLGIFAIFFASSSRKLKKRKQQMQEQEQRQRPRRPAVRPVMTSSYEETPKNQEYFTYETFEPEIKEEVPEEEVSPVESVDKNVQIVDSEDEKKLQISLEMEDLYKGVIYSEILKRPYN